MDELNSTTSRKLSPIESMQRLEKACYASDARLKIRMDLLSKSRMGLVMLFGLPFGVYLTYNSYAPGGVWMNFRATNGVYMYYMQNFIGPQRSYQEQYRPELYRREQSSSLFQYSKKIEQLKKEESDQIVQGVHYPSMWH